ncbi:hypothetical protein QN277_005102 [Acacia crassicarpa]|uniref:Uncharacterized protein n=1 Tax=Acacia crassicarpa TaxID=499986 RepID=A0AAE1JST5_9FABA|nr:hypothetical protein QN277_005102 [Acacia crassicarpa]
MKNMMKAMKKLKFWSRKKNKRKNYLPYCPPPPTPYPPPPPPCRHYCACSSPAEPSAPPLPPWLEVERNHGTFLQPSFYPAPEVVTFPSQAQVHAQEIVEEPNKPVFQNMQRSSSYQQYMFPEHVYGITISQAAKKERSGGLFGCVFSFGTHLFRCLFPCFHIREV